MGIQLCPGIRATFQAIDIILQGELLGPRRETLVALCLSGVPVVLNYLAGSLSNNDNE